jgi:FtsP/CotA-like multicopper oxidase with cupredoxin domain
VERRNGRQSSIAVGGSAASDGANARHSDPSPYRRQRRESVSLIAEPLTHRISPFKTITAWGYNGSVPGPTIQVTQGDRVRIVVENRQPESTTVHWHGFEIPFEMDGTPYISQKPIPPGGKCVYEFDLHQEGTFFYHSHGAMQEMIGMIGMFIMHPRESHRPQVDHSALENLKTSAVTLNGLVLSGGLDPPSMIEDIEMPTMSH